ncbi:hypothetical protein DAEQUDRAFT_812383 [Daedalea quercina L-15889]|uniref:BTB domain-containing protein n=1 Tax=Daedalea quercina L-15889 TaxID=1314783 RepID=A0A165PCA9_9APHY|nr:hypothetical protein DAEQUDRAFT_812383 [Daedalea quercina L-15889]
MQVAFSDIATNYDIKLRFRVDDAREFFVERDDSELGFPERRKTDTFGPGLYIECRRNSINDEDCMSCYLYAGLYPYPGPVSWSVVGESLQGDIRYFEHSTTHTFTSGFGIGWGDALSKTKHWDELETLRQENALYITVTVQARLGFTACPSKCLDVSHKVVTTERPCDLQFVAYSARSRTGELSDSHELFADRETINKTCPQLAKYLKHPNRPHRMVSGLFLEADLHMDSSTDDRANIISCTADGSDSDFEDELNLESTQSVVGEDNDFIVAENDEAPVTADPSIGGTSHHGDTNGTVPWDAPPSDDASEWIFDDFEPAANVNEVVHPSGEVETEQEPDPLVVPADITDGKTTGSCESPPHCATQRTLPITTVVGAASSTWEAFLFYLYTDAVVFTPLTSRGQDTRKAFIADYKEKNPHRPAPCSCKSMYRLAYKLGMAELKALALKDLGSQISKENVVAEVFTEFTSEYEEVKNVEVKVLKEHWAELKNTKQVLEIFVKIARGDIPHAAGIMAAIHREDEPATGGFASLGTQERSQ